MNGVYNEPSQNPQITRSGINGIYNSPSQNSQIARSGIKQLKQTHERTHQCLIERQQFIWRLIVGAICILMATSCTLSYGWRIAIFTISFLCWVGWASWEVEEINQISITTSHWGVETTPSRRWLPKSLPLRVKGERTTSVVVVPLPLLPCTVGGTSFVPRPTTMLMFIAVLLGLLLWYWWAIYRWQTAV